jgi:hypothetical protein
MSPELKSLLERISETSKVTAQSQTHFGGKFLMGNCLKSMVGWDGIEPPTPGFSDPPTSPSSDESSVATRNDP